MLTADQLLHALLTETGPPRALTAVPFLEARPTPDVDIKNIRVPKDVTDRGIAARNAVRVKAGRVALIVLEINRSVDTRKEEWGSAAYRRGDVRSMVYGPPGRILPVLQMVRLYAEQKRMDLDIVASAAMIDAPLTDRSLLLPRRGDATARGLRRLRRGR